MEYETRVISMVVTPKNEPIFSEGVTTITIEDDSGGEFVVISQSCNDYGKIAINPEEWPLIRDAIDKMIGECRS